MIEKLRFRWFKSIEHVEFEPGRVNVLIGANGSGKSNLLEAIGILSAAAHGRVDDEALLRRGVRPGVPALYKCSFPGMVRTPHISFGAWSSSASFEVSLFNPIKAPLPAWRYHTENLTIENHVVVGRSHRSAEKYNPEAGLAALKAVDLDLEDPGLRLLSELRDYAIFAPDTNTLRGLIADPQQRVPMGLSGGRLPDALSSLLKMRQDDTFVSRVCREALSLIDWARSYGTAPASSMPLASSVGSTQRVIRFTDRFMNSKRNTLTAYDASEGALYVLFHAVLAGHPNSPAVCAVDNADHALNPRLAQALFGRICDWHLSSLYGRQIFLTTQNPLTLDALPLQQDQVRLFTVDRSRNGRTTVERVVMDQKLERMASEGWTLSRLWVMGHLGGVPNV
jgi:energy-coupling factor transporter ATP-binding protein EcfA2